MRAPLGRLTLATYRLGRRVLSKSFSVLAAGAFAEFGSASTIQPPLRVSGERRISIGARVFIGPDCWLQVLDDEPGHTPALVVGEGTKIVGGAVLSAARSIRLGRQVLIARNVYVSDHQHAYADPTRAVLEQGIAKVAPVVIGDGAWLGENVVVGPGVTIGRGAVIGANAVVLSDVADHAVAVGVPAREVRRVDPAR
ncbi:MAG: acyltransferase [Propionibacteriaceae bacterium]